MAKSLADLRTVRADTPPLFVAYGDDGLGKTTFASEWPSPVFIQCEQGTPKGPDLVSFGEIESFDDVLSAMGSLLTQQHEHRTLVVDTLDSMEELMHDQVCAANGWDNIKSPGYGDGYAAVGKSWGHFLKGCRKLTREAGMAVVLISHLKQVTIKPPISDPYSKWVLKLSDSAWPLVKDEADIVAFFNRPMRVLTDGKKKEFGKVGRGLSSGEYAINFYGEAGFLGKNRYQMPEKIEWRVGEGYAAIKDYFPQPAGQAA